jgi:hypothetical protein
MESVTKTFLVKKAAKQKLGFGISITYPGHHTAADFW